MNNRAKGTLSKDSVPFCILRHNSKNRLWRFFMPAGKEVQPECFSQTTRGGLLNCSCSRNRDLTAINPAVPEVMKTAALAVSTAHIGNMSFAFSKSVPTAPAKGRGKRLSAWTNRRVKSLAPCAFSDTKTAKAYCNTKTAENGFLIFHADQERK